MNTRFNLFSYGAQIYSASSSPAPASASASASAAAPSGQTQRVEPVPRNMSSSFSQQGQGPSTPRGDIIYTAPVRQSTLTSANILMALLGIGGTKHAWASFNTPVIVAPSAETISLNTHILNGITNVTCAICQDSIVASDTCRRLNPCQHTYHQVCIDQWFQRSVACPTCRHDIRDPTPISPQLTAVSAAELADTLNLSGGEGSEN